MTENRIEPCRIGLTAASLTGNKGAAAMASAVIAGLARRLPAGSGFLLFSPYPRRDRESNTFDNLKIVPAPPLHAVIILPAFSFAFHILRRLRLPASPLVRLYQPLGAMLSCDLILDLSGISFVQGRTPALAYNIACLLPPLLLGIPVVKLSQAFGPLGRGFTRTAARLLLPRLAAVFPRGPVSASHLDSAGIGHSGVATDLAFTLPSPQIRAGSGGPPRIAFIPSEVMRRKCVALGIDYAGEMAGFCRSMIRDHGCKIVLIAHSNLGPDAVSHNNDFGICSEILRAIGQDGDVETHLEEKGPEELRELIGGCAIAVSSRFHGMVSALASCVPVVATAWSHKYAEVMDAFGMSGMVVPARELSAGRLSDLALRLLADRDSLAATLASSLAAVRRGSESQLDFVADLLMNQAVPEAGHGRSIPQRFLPQGCRPLVMIGFSTDPRTLDLRASGGLVTSLLAARMEGGRSQGAIVAFSGIEDGRLILGTRLARTPEDVLNSAGSIYGWTPHLARTLEILREIDEPGPIDVVVLPCQAKALRRAAIAEPTLAAKLGLVLCLWCGHATRISLARHLIGRWARGREPVDFRYRSGRWRGSSRLALDDGTLVEIPFGKGFGLFQNLHADCRMHCLCCRDHLGMNADVSFGDAWTGMEKYSRNKKTIALAMTDPGREALESFAFQGRAVLRDAPESLVVSAQKRSLAWHDRGPTRAAIAPLFGYRLPGERRIALSHVPAAFMEMSLVRAFDSPLRKFLLSLPWWAWMPCLASLKAVQSVPRVGR
ncbi:MAG TPA: polysaccharide pyruvyl transferase family protein [Candidatus Fermentibacter daniensis]|nr:polysaccharide pyruvyl transferase family protein [Candidatus Fermentibacter daniensis]HPH40753.1 polysaccharide pyruvyl transferase family protein [Candidatus Fermentibacter daniensis]HPN63563.1 polysaccharide pyruvyl transferase family protein [Candidatus Fermentibacter daniensis]